MFNGVGLQTPRGSGTAGYAQVNKFSAKPKPAASAGDAHAAATVKKPDEGILEHERKRRIELKLLVLREALPDHGYSEPEISAKIDEERMALETADSVAPTMAVKRNVCF